MPACFRPVFVLCVLAFLFAAEARSEVVTLPIAAGSNLRIRFDVYFEGELLGSPEATTYLSGAQAFSINRGAGDVVESIDLLTTSVISGTATNYVVDFSNTPFGDFGTAVGSLSAATANLFTSTFDPVEVSPVGGNAYSGSLIGIYAEILSGTGAIGPAVPGTFLDVALRLANPDDGIFDFSITYEIQLQPSSEGDGDGTGTFYFGPSNLEGATLEFEAIAYDAVAIGGGLPFQIDVTIIGDIQAGVIPEVGTLGLGLAAFAVAIVAVGRRRRGSAAAAH